MGCGGSKDAVQNNQAPSVVYESDYEYVSWSLQMQKKGLTVARPKTSAEALAVVNAALKDGKRIRVMGHRHNWSPITISPQSDADIKDVILLSLKDMEVNFVVDEKDARAGGKPTATVSLGCPQEKFLTLLEDAARTQTGSDKSAAGFGVAHCPAPDTITMGGMVAINGHGTAVSSEEEKKHVGEGVSYGSWSNRLVALRAIVWDAAAAEYVEREFLRSTNEGRDIAPLLTSVGRAVLTYGTFQVEPNYYMRCRSFMGIEWETMFAPLDAEGKPQPKSMAWFMERHGRVEAIWYPFTDKPWLKVWTVTGSEKPARSKEVKTPCNYPFSDQLPDFLTSLIKVLTGSLADTAIEKVGINASINSKSLEDLGVSQAKCQQLMVAFMCVSITDADAGVADDDTDEVKATKRDEAAKARLAKTEEGAQLMKEAQAMTEQLQAVKAGEGVATVDGEDAAEAGEWYEAEEGHPLDNATWDGADTPWQDLARLWRWGGLTPYFSRMVYARTVAGLKENHSYDIWGPSKNTLIYVRDTTIKVTANGYAILCNRKHVGNVMHKFAHLFQGMLQEYRDGHEGSFDGYPIAMPLEIRVTGLDDPTVIGDGTSVSPSLSALYQSAADREAGYDCCLWLDVLSMPGNWASNRFYHDMETRLVKDPTFNGPNAKLRPEWSKGWGYSAEGGAWFDADFLRHTRSKASLPEWNAAHATLDAYDKKDLFRNKWMDNFFRTVNDAGEGITDSAETQQKQEADTAAAPENNAAAPPAEEAAPAAAEEKPAEAAAPAPAAEEKPAEAAAPAPAAEEKPAEAAPEGEKPADA